MDDPTRVFPGIGLHPGGRFARIHPRASEGLPESAAQPFAIRL